LIWRSTGGWKISPFSHRHCNRQKVYLYFSLLFGGAENREHVSDLVEKGVDAAREMGMARLIGKATALEKAYELA
jgi:hypothetical protein